MISVKFPGSAATAWARASDKRPQSTGTAAQRLQAKAVVRASEQAAGRSYVYERAVVQVRKDKAIVGVVAPGKNEATSTVFIVDLTKGAVLAARSIQFAERASGKIAMTVADGTKTRFRGTLDAKSRAIQAAPGYRQVLKKAAAHDAKCSASKATRTANGGQTVQAAVLCEWAVGALCGTGGAVGCYGACVALGLVNFPGGLGCAAVCGLIAGLGCTGATEAICE
jgi:halocin C8-like bacteriocin domain-containing protein